MKSKAINKLVQSDEKTSLTLQTDLRSMEEQCHVMSQNMDQLDAWNDDANALHILLHIQLKQHRNVLSQREKDADELAGAVETARLIYDKLVADQTKAEEMRRDVEKEAQHKRRKACTTKDDLERMKQKLKKKLVIEETKRQALPALTERIKQAEVELKKLKEMNKGFEASAAMLKQDVDTSIAWFLQQEVVEGKFKGNLKAAVVSTDDLEAEVAIWAKEARMESMLVDLLAKQRQIKKNEAKRIEELIKELTKQIDLRKLHLTDLKTRSNDLSNQILELSATSNVLADEHKSCQSLTRDVYRNMEGLKGKIDTLCNELRKLHDEESMKDKAIKKQHAENSIAAAQKDALRVEHKEKLNTIHLKNEKLRHQSLQIQKHTSLTNDLRQDMLYLKSESRAAMNTRDLNQVKFICQKEDCRVLHEKVNHQEQALAHEKKNISTTEEGLRLLRLQAANIDRCTEAVRHRLCNPPVQAETIALLQQQIAQQQNIAEQLSHKLKDSKYSFKTPARECIPSKDELEVNIAILEKMLANKEEELLKKDIVAKQLTSECDDLLTKIATQKKPKKSINLVSRVSGANARLREATRRRLSTISELSMYQAMAVKFEQENEKNDTELSSEGCNPIEQGDEPFRKTEEYKKQNHYHRQRTVTELTTNKKDKKVSVGSFTRRQIRLGVPHINSINTTAKVRPNAYIPDNDKIGIPKPYGPSAPFKPSFLPVAVQRRIRPTVA